MHPRRRQAVRAHASRRCRLRAPGNCSAFGFRLRKLNAGPQPPDRGKRHHDALAGPRGLRVHDHRRPDLAFPVGKIEAGGKDADDGVLPVVQRDRPADDVGRASELARPERVAEDGDLIGSGLFFARREQPSAFRRHAQHGKHR
jgi:hypothetical protein